MCPERTHCRSPLPGTPDAHQPVIRVQDKAIARSDAGAQNLLLFSWLVKHRPSSFQECVGGLSLLTGDQNNDWNVGPEELQKRSQPQPLGERVESLRLKQTHCRGDSINLVNFPDGD